MSTDSQPRQYLTPSESFYDVSRGNPRPHSLEGEALVKARLTRETWRLEIVSDGSTQVEKPCRFDDGTAIGTRSKAKKAVVAPSALAPADRTLSSSARLLE